MEMEIPVLSFADLYGGKICAALDRQHPRDLFDIKLLSEARGLNEEVSQAFVIYLASHNRPMSELLSPNFQGMNGNFCCLLKWEYLISVCFQFRVLKTYRR